MDTLHYRGKLRRKAAQLPCYVEIPASLVAAWDLHATTVVEARANGLPLGRRALKPWGDDQRWFIELTDAHCRRLGTTVAAMLDLVLERADTSAPEEVSRLLADSTARTRWERMSESQRRMFCEHVRAAKRASTRTMRARKVLLTS